MTLKGLSPRLPRIGRLRCGEKGAKGQPVKLKTWRATSHDEPAIEAFAALFGGTPEVWEDAPEGEQWQVTSDASIIDVLLPPDPLGGTPIYERWGSGGCQRRCDGENAMVLGTDGMVDQHCLCSEKGWSPGDGDDMKKGACDLMLRLAVVLPDLPGLGVWQLVTGSVYAAMEIPGQVGMLRALSGDSSAYIPAGLAIEQRVQKKPWEKFKRDFIVPTLRVRDSLRDLGASGPRALKAADEPLDVDLGDSMQLQSHVSMATKNAGLDDEERHWLIWLVTEGRVRSSREVTPAEAKEVIATADRIRDGWLALELVFEGPEVINAHLVEQSKKTAPPPPGVDDETGEVIEANATEKPKTPPKRSGGSPFPRVIRTRAKAAKLTEEELAVICQEAVGKATPEDVDGPDESNKVLDAISAATREGQGTLA